MPSIPARRISFTKRSCRVSNSRSMRPLACGLCAAIHSIPSSFRARPNCDRASSPCSCSPIPARRLLRKNAVFIGVMGQRTSVAPQPPAQRSQVLFRAVVLGKAGPELAGGVIDQGDQLTSRAALLQPSERRAILHHQLSKTGSSLPPHIDLFHALPVWAPDGRLGHPLPQGLPAHR